MVSWLGQTVRHFTHEYQPPQGQREPPEDEEIVQAKSKAKDDAEDDNILYGEFEPIEVKYESSVEKKSERVKYAWAERKLKKAVDLYDIPPRDRGTVYQHMYRRLIDICTSRVVALMKTYNLACEDAQISRWEKNVRVIHQEGVRVVGCTVAGLNKYRGMIAALEPRVLLIEEAAETKEANITSAMYPSLQQVALVGDHQQLVPSVDVELLGQPPHNLNISLLERLVNLEIPMSTLQVQRRMRPQICNVVRTFYPNLTDHPLVCDLTHRPLVPGMGDNSLWWYQHAFPEGKSSNGVSYRNTLEAQMIIGFVRYLVLNQVAPDRITILSYYKGQVNHILYKLHSDPILGVMVPDDTIWSVRTVDSFQGEENDIIILSLVRSPETAYQQARAGFVQNENRAVVATSRARCGMYIFGNAYNILHGSVQSQETWQKVFEVFKASHCTGDKLPVTCQKHQKTTEISSPREWELVSGGGCEKPCGGRCAQGHDCQRACHVDGNCDIGCLQACKRRLGCGHSCKMQCQQRCKCIHECKTAEENVRPQIPNMGKLIPKQLPKPETPVKSWSGCQKITRERTDSGRCLPEKALPYRKPDNGQRTICKSIPQSPQQPSCSRSRASGNASRKGAAPIPRSDLAIRGKQSPGPSRSSSQSASSTRTGGSYRTLNDVMFDLQPPTREADVVDRNESVHCRGRQPEHFGLLIDVDDEPQEHVAEEVDLASSEEDLIQFSEESLLS